MMRRFSLFIIIMAFLPALAYAATLSPADADKGRAIIKKLGDEAIVFLGNKDLSKAEQKEQFRALFDDYFASDRIARFVLGRHARQASPEQISEFKDLFQRLLVEIYASRLSDFKGQSLAVTSAQLDDNKRFVLVYASILDPSSGSKVALQWRLVPDGNTLRIMDITVEGISMGLSLRSEYAAIIERQSKGVAGLLTVMRQKLAELENGATAKP